MHAGIAFRPAADELRGKLLGLIGFGASAIEFAWLGRAFGMRFAAVDIRDITDQEAAERGLEWRGKPEDIDALLPMVDILSVHLHLDDRTRGLQPRRARPPAGVPNRLMRIGVIGLGTIGETHLAALRQLRVREIFGADTSAAARARAEDGVGRCFADYGEMLSGADLDAVVVATPPRTHREIAIAALDAGLGVLCEKPLAVTVEDCGAISTAVAQAGGPFQVGFCHRFQPQVRALRQLLDSGAIGRPVLVSVSFIHGLSEQGREWITDADQAGGGVLFDSGSHAIDLFRYLVGDVDEVHGLTAVMDRGSGSKRVEDTSIVSLRSGDVLGIVALSWKTPPWQGLVEVVGSMGRARVDYEGDRVSLRLRTGDAPWRTVRTPRMSRFVSQMQHFLACMRGEEAPEASVQDGLAATRLVLQIYDQVRSAPSR